MAFCFCEIIGYYLYKKRKNMKRIATFTNKEADGCAWYRHTGVLGELRRHNIDIQRMLGMISWQDLSNCDIGFIHRPYTQQHVAIAKLIKQQMPLWIDFDDLLLGIPESNPSYHIYADPAIQAAILEVIDLADVITVSTEELRRAINLPKTRVIHNAYNDYRLPTEWNKIPREQKVVLWRGTNSHVGDLMHFKEELNALIRLNPDTRFVFLGFVPWMLDMTAINVDLVAEQNMYDYFKLIDQINPDVTIVPLEDNLFNQCKSNIALLETARTGPKCVAPSWEEWDLPGVYGYGDDLFAATNDALNSEEDGEAAWDYIRENYMLSDINNLRVEVVNDLS